MIAIWNARVNVSTWNKAKLLYQFTKPVSPENVGVILKKNKYLKSTVINNAETTVLHR